MDFDILGTIKKINMMNDNKERYRNYHNLKHFLSFLYDVELISEVEFNNYLDMIIDVNQLEKLEDKMENQIKFDILKNTKELNHLFQPILKSIPNDKLRIEYGNYHKLDQLLYYAEDFFKLLGDDVYKLYSNIFHHDLIIEKENYSYGGSCGYINGDLSTIVLKKNDNPLHKINALVHEIGHAYDNYLNKTQDYKRAYQINCEFTSMTFELLFINYLKENNVITSIQHEMGLKKYYIIYLIQMNNAYIYNKLFLEGQLFNNQLFDVDMLVNQGIIKDTAIKGYLEDVSIYSNSYGLGLITASYYLQEFQKNANSTIKEIKDFSCLSNNLTTSEIINYYPIKELAHNMTENTSKILKKHHN